MANVVVTQLVVDASGAKLGVAEFTAAMDKAKQAAVDGGDATATSFERAQSRWTASLAKTDPVIKAQIAMEKDLARQREIGADAVKLGIATQDAVAAQLDKVSQKHQAYIATIGSAGTATTGFNAILDAGRGAALGYAAGIGPIGAVLGSFGPWGIAAAAGIGLVTNALGYMNQKANEIGTESSGLKQFADTTGLTVTQVRGLTEAGAELGIASDTVSSSIQKFTFSLDEARKGGGALFDQVQAIDAGLANEIASTRSGAEALDILTKAYNSTTDATTKAAIAKAAFGKGGAAFGTVLNVVGEAGGVDAYSASVQKALGVTDEWTNKVAALRNENRSLESDLKLIEASIYSEAALERQNRFLKTQIDIAKAIRDAAAHAGDGPSTDEFGTPFDFSLLNKNKAAKSAAATASDSPAAGVGETTALEATTKATNDLTAARLESMKAEQQAATSAGNMVALLGGAATGAEIAEANFHRLSAAFLANKFGASDSAEAIDKFNRALHGDTANTVAALQDQLAVITAIGGAERQNAQYALDYNAAKRAGKQDVDAIQIATDKMALAQATANKAVDDQVRSLKDQNAMIKAQQNGTEKSTASAIAYKNAIASGADAASAAALATETARGYTLRAAAAALEWQQNLFGVSAAAKQAVAAMNAAQYNADIAFDGVKGQIVGGDTGHYASSSSLFNPDPANTTKTSGSAFLLPQNVMDAAQKKYDQTGHSTWINGIGWIPNLPQRPNAAPDQSALSDQATNSLVGAGNLSGALSAAMGFGEAGMSNVDAITQLMNGMTSNKGAQASNLQSELAWLNTLPETIARDQKIVSLQQSIDSLINSTDSLNSTNQDLLSPYYTQDPRTSHIGFRSQGMATGGEITVPGGYSANDNMLAQIPVASGEIVSVRRPGQNLSGGSVINVVNNINVRGNVDKATVNAIGRTAYQSTQSAARNLQAASR
jgi:hypothetical protein